MFIFLETVIKILFNLLLWKLPIGIRQKLEEQHKQNHKKDFMDGSFPYSVQSCSS